MDQRLAYVWVTTLADSEERWLGSSRLLSGNEAKPRCELAATLERCSVPDGSYQRRGAERANAGHTHQAATGIVALGDFAVESRDIRPAAEALTEISRPS